MADDQWAAFRVNAPTPTMQVAPPTAAQDDPWAAFRQQQPPMTAGEVATGAVRNLWPSTKQFASDLVQPVIHPVETVTGLNNLRKGLLQKARSTVRGEAPGEDEKYADAVGQHLAERYGGWENLKRTMASDPVGFLADASIVLSGGGSAAARLPGVAGRVGEITSTVGRSIDPINIATKTVKGLGEVGAAALDVGTGTGLKTVKTAATSGYEGGKAGEAFRENMRGNVPIEDVVTDAKTAVGNMRADRGQKYVANMATVGANPAILNFTEIDRALNQANAIKQFKGQSLSPKTAGVRQEINDAVDAWRKLPPDQYHTAVGLDALKQLVGDIMEAHPYNTPQRLVAEKAYNAIKQTIIKQEPGYAQIMADYEKASTHIKEIERTLSLGKKASADSAVRKLQSVMRNNVNTNFGNRTNLAQSLTQNGAPQLMEALAGQSMNSLAPRGLSKLGVPMAGAAAFAHPAALALLPFQSPRLVGEAVHAGGRAAGGVAKALASIPGNTSKARRAALIAALVSGRDERYAGN